MNILQRWLARLLPEEALYLYRKKRGGYITNNGHAVFYAEVYPRLKAVAQRHGWALALHGSMNHDLDLMAMPWEDAPSRPADFIDAMRRCLDLPEDAVRINFSKPNGRIVYILTIAPGFYLDLNIINHALGYPEEHEDIVGDAE